LNSINVFYFDKKSICAIDFVFLFRTIFDFFPESEIKFSEMSEKQKALSSENEFGITCIKTVFMIFDGDVRRRDIENRIIMFASK